VSEQVPLIKVDTARNHLPITHGIFRKK